MATRRERVILELQDDLSSGMVKAAGATKLLDAELNRLSGRAVVTGRASGTASRDVDNLGTSSRRTSADINQLSGRLSILLRTAAVLGPALAPIGAVGVAGVAGLASQFGFAATGAISLVAAAQGVGDALKAVNEAALEPTAANLEKAREAMAKIGPDAQAFVTRFQEIRPVLNDIRDAAAAGWFPGLTESLTSLEQVAPEVASLFEKIGTVGGNLVAEGAAAFAGPGWADFRSFVAAEAPQALDDLGRTLGNVAKGLAELWMAFGPLNSSFSSWMLDASRGFADWAAGLSETEGFAEFIDYVRTNGPLVADAAVAIANAILQIAEAAAPLGGPVLEALTSIADAIALIADSPIGPPIMAGVAAMSALSLATNVATSALSRFTVASAAAGAAGGKAGLSGKLAAASLPVGLAAAGSTLIPDTKDTERPGPAFNDPFVGPLKALLKQDADQWAGSSFVKKLFGGGDRLISDDMIAGITEMSSALDGLAGSAEATNEALAEQSRITLGAFSATTQYREALKAAQEQANKNNAGIKGNSDAALENRAALEQLAGAWQNQRDEMVQAGKSTEDIERKQASARRAFIETATAMGVPIKQARRLATELLGIPPKVKSDVTVNTAAANAALRTLRAQLDGIRNKDITVSTTFKNFYAGPAGKGGGKQPKVPQIPGVSVPGNGADGTTVPKTGLPYADRHLYLLADGERVTSNRFGQVDKSQRTLDLINSGRLNDRILGLADGGTAGKPGKRRKNEIQFLETPETSALIKSLNFDHLGRSIRRSIAAFEASKSAIEDELSSRESLSSALSSAVSSKITSDLFGGATDVWSKGGTFEDVMAQLSGDIASGNALSANIAALQGKGLDGPALDALLAQGDSATIANFAALTAAQLDQYEQQYETRNALATAVGQQASAAAGYTAQIVALQAKVDQTNALLSQLNGIQKAIEKDGPKKTGHEAAKAGNKGAGKGARNRRKG